MLHKALSKTTITKYNYLFYSSTSSIVSFTILILLLNITNHAHASLTSTMQKLKISPDIIPLSSDSQIAKVQLNGNDIKPGDPIPAKNLRYLDKNKVHWDVSSDDARYTVMLFDLDRKTTTSAGSNSFNNTNLSLYNQYTSINIQGNTLINGQDIVQYEPPSVPCNPSTKHRIVMLVFYQAETIDLSKAALYAASIGETSKRENFKMSDFVNHFSLSPVAGNIFLAIGESGGVCSGSGPLPMPSLTTSLILILMVILTIGTTTRASILSSHQHMR